MKIVIIIFGIFCVSINAQEINKIKNQNVCFVFFDGSDLTKKGCNTIKKRINCAYYFYDSNKNMFEFSFKYSKYSTFDDALNEMNPAMVFKLNKSFLRKNKDIIITREFMEEVGEDAMIDLLFREYKTYFLIDKNEIENNKILVREVRFDYSAPE